MMENEENLDAVVEQIKGKRNSSNWIIGTPSVNKEELYNMFNGKGSDSMNLLENYIKEIHEVKEVKEDWGSFILADVTINCYGITERKEASFSSWEEWKKVKEQGYYMA
jgi:hypothetical protein